MSNACQRPARMLRIVLVAVAVLLEIYVLADAKSLSPIPGRRGLTGAHETLAVLNINAVNIAFDFFHHNTDLTWLSKEAITLPECCER